MRNVVAEIVGGCKVLLLTCACSSWFLTSRQLPDVSLHAGLYQNGFALLETQQASADSARAMDHLCRNKQSGIDNTGIRIRIQDLVYKPIQATR